MATNSKNILTMAPITTKEHAFTPNLPSSIWLPYEQRLSERYICEDDKQVYERFREISTLYENDDFPDDDLETENTTLPEGLIAWNSSSGKLCVGTVIRVKGCDGEILFEEEIIGEMRLGRLTYFVAGMMALRLEDSYEKLYSTLRFAGMFWSDDRKTDIPDSSIGNIVKKVNVRGTRFIVTFRQVLAQKEETIYAETKEGSISSRVPAGGKLTKVEISISGEHITEFMLLGSLMESTQRVWAELGAGF